MQDLLSLLVCSNEKTGLQVGTVVCQVLEMAVVGENLSDISDMTLKMTSSPVNSQNIDQWPTVF